MTGKSKERLWGKIRGGQRKRRGGKGWTQGKLSLSGEGPIELQVPSFSHHSDLSSDLA